jgi:hypothetical protein
VSELNRQPRRSSRAAVAPLGVRSEPDVGRGDSVLPISATREQLVKMLDGPIAQMEIVPAEEIVESLGETPPVGWGSWVARQVSLGNLEVRVSRGHLYSEVEDAEEVDWLPGTYLAGSLLFLGKGISILDPACRTDAKLLEHEAIHYFDEGYENSTRRRVSGVETELHAFFRGEVFELRREQWNRRRKLWLWPSKLRRIRQRLRRKIVVSGYYGVTSDISVVEHAEEQWLPAYAGSKTLPLRGRLRARVAKAMLGLDGMHFSRCPDGVLRPPGSGVGLEEAMRRANLRQEDAFQSYDPSERRRIWRTRLGRCLGRASLDTTVDDEWPGLDAFPRNPADRREWASRPSEIGILEAQIVELCRMEAAERQVALEVALEEMERETQPGSRKQLSAIIADLRLDARPSGDSR